MQYRRLGRTDLLVSEVSLAARDLSGLPEADAEAMLRAALVEGVSLVLLDPAASPDAAALLGRVSGNDRPRLTVAAHLGHAAAPDELAARLTGVAGDLCGFVDVAVLPGLPDAATLSVIEAARGDGALRFLGLAVHSPEGAQAALDTGLADVVIVPVLDEAFAEIARIGDLGVIVDGGWHFPLD